jgi:hypothetical protein
MTEETFTNEPVAAPVKAAAKRPSRPAARARAAIRSEPELASPENRLRRAGRPDTARIQRAPAREELREDDARTAAPAERMTRRRRRTEDAFRIDRSMIPHGSSYEWKRKATYGAPDPDHQVNLRENGWRPVPSSRHPHLMPDGHNGPVEKNGMVLMERPSYLTEEARQEDYEIAIEQVHGKEAQINDTPAGHFSREHPSARRNTGIKKSYEPMPILD